MLQHTARAESHDRIPEWYQHNEYALEEGLRTNPIDNHSDDQIELDKRDLLFVDRNEGKSKIDKPDHFRASGLNSLSLSVVWQWEIQSHWLLQVLQLRRRPAIDPITGPC